MPHSEPHPSVSVAEGGPPLAVEHLTVVVAPGGQVPSLPRGWREIRVDASQLQGGLSALLVSDRLARALDLRGGSASGAACWGMNRPRMWAAPCSRRSSASPISRRCR